MPVLDLRGLGLASTGLLALTFGLVRGTALGWTSLPVLAIGAVRLAQRLGGERDDGQAHRDVRPEDPLPVDALDDGAADEWPDRDAEARDAAPDAERRGALLDGETPH